jgi:GTPase
MFIDEVKIKVISWKGWDGLISWRREKYIPKWWPRWGDGWDGWNVCIKTDENINTLSEYRHKKVLIAENGEKGWTKLMHWANAPELILKVPVGTIVKDENTGEILADLSENNTKLLVVKWWKWGFGNAHFCSSTRQAPSFAELWDIALKKDLHLELKLVADIWIIGIPSSWKSTFIWNVTNVKPKIWDYPFTTLTPNLWVLDHKWKSLVLEDVPWLIPWASKWKWLGIEFLKHIERTGVLLHLLDLYRLDKVFQDYEDIRHELEVFSPDLKKKEEIIVFSKADLLDEEMKKFIMAEFKKKYPKKKVFIISSATWEGVDELVDFLIDEYSNSLPNTESSPQPSPEGDGEEQENIKIYDLKDSSDPKKFTLKYIWNFTFECHGERIEQIVRMTDFENREAVLRVYDVLEKQWITKKLEPKLKEVFEKEGKDNSFFFEWNDEDAVNPKIIIAEKQIPLDKLKYDL